VSPFRTYPGSRLLVLKPEKKDKGEKAGKKASKAAAANTEHRTPNSATVNPKSVNQSDRRNYEITKLRKSKVSLADRQSDQTNNAK